MKKYILSKIKKKKPLANKKNLDYNLKNVEMEIN